MKKIIALALTLVMVLSMGAVAVAEAPIKLNIAYMPNYASLWSVLAGIEQGYFAEEGLDVTLVEFADGPTIINAMENGSIDLGYIGPGAHKLCINGRAKIFAFSQLGNSDHVLASKKAGIETLADLKGKKVGYSSGTSSEMILKYGLEEAGLAWSDIVAVEMDASALVSAMLSGGIDACAAWSPSTTTIMKNANGDVFSLCSNATFSDRSVSPASWIVMPNYAVEKRDIVVKFTRALYKAMDFGADPANFDTIAGYVAKQCACGLDVAQGQTMDGDWPTKAKVLELVNNGGLEKIYKIQQDAFIASQAVEKEVPVADYVLFDVMIEAGK